MGVIDLNARVTELEKYGGAVFDQLAAEVTGIENDLTPSVVDLTEEFQTATTAIVEEGITVAYAYLITYGKLAILKTKYSSEREQTALLHLQEIIPEQYLPGSRDLAISGNLADIFFEDNAGTVYVAVTKAGTLGPTNSVNWMAWIIDPPTT